MDVISDRARLARIAGAFAIALGSCAFESGQAVLTTTGRGNQVLVLPTPADGLPSPVMEVVTGLPAGAAPHGATLISNSQVLVADGGHSRLYVVDMTQAAVIQTLDTSAIGYDGWGTIAAGPASAALAASDHDSNLYVFTKAPDGSIATTKTPLSGTVDRFQTDAIVFDSSGRAFVHCVKTTAPMIGAETPDALNVPSTSMAIDVFDPPYTAKSFTMRAPVEDLSGALTISNDGQTLLATDRIDGSVVIFQAPFSASTVPVVRPTPSGTHAFSGIVAVPGGSEDNSAIVVVDSAKPFSEYFDVPYATSEAADLDLPSSVTAFSTGFESVTLSYQLADGSSVAIATGEVQGSVAGQPALFTVVPQGSNSSPLFYAVTIPGGGRGQGCARIARKEFACSGRGCVHPIGAPELNHVTQPGGR